MEFLQKKHSHDDDELKSVVFFASINSVTQKTTRNEEKKMKRITTGKYPGSLNI